MLAKCFMAGKHIHQYRSQELLCIPLVNTISVLIVILTKIKMLLKVNCIIQLLLLCIHSSVAVRGPPEILVHPVKAIYNSWATEGMHNYEERYPELVLYDGDHIPGLPHEMVKDMDYTGISIDTHTLVPKNNDRYSQPFFGMLPLFMEVTGKNYEMVGQRNAVVLPADGTFKLACVTYGIPHFTTSWTDGDGKRVNFVSKPSHDGLINYDAKVLTLNVHTINSTSFGCEFKDQLYGISHYKWFNFTLVEKPDVKIYTDNNTCGEVTFTCLDGESQPEKVNLNFTFV